jgi:hypothetical protein
MSYPVEDIGSRGYRPTEPFDASDLARSNQLSETAKDVFKAELTKYFNFDASYDGRTKLIEIPNIDKFAIGTAPTEQNLETFVNLIMSYSDTPDRFPMVAITSASVREKRLGLGNNYMGIFQYPPSVSGTKSGPFDIYNNWTITLKTWPFGVATRRGPTGDHEDVTLNSTITFVDGFFTDPRNATIDEIVKAINIQALYYKASANADGSLRLDAGGILAPSNPNYIEITGGTAECLSALGLTVGQSSSSVVDPPRNRYFTAADMVINIDVVSDDINTKQELADLVYAYFTYYTEKRFFQLLGRSYFQRGLDPEEWYHIIFKGEFNWSGETSIPRPGQEGYDRIYSVRGSVPITIIDYVDKRLEQPPINVSDITLEEDTFPDGDYPGQSYLGSFSR